MHVHCQYINCTFFKHQFAWLKRLTVIVLLCKYIIINVAPGRHKCDAETYILLDVFVDTYIIYIYSKSKYELSLIHDTIHNLFAQKWHIYTHRWMIYSSLSQGFASKHLVSILNKVFLPDYVDYASITCAIGT